MKISQDVPKEAEAGMAQKAAEFPVPALVGHLPHMTSSSDRGAYITKALAERPWGTRDLYVEDPDGYILWSSEGLNRHPVQRTTPWEPVKQRPAQTARMTIAALSNAPLPRRPDVRRPVDLKCKVLDHGE